MTRDPRITPEQEAEESSVRFGLVADCGLLVVLVLSGFLGGSLTILAEAIRGSLMSLTELFSLVVMRRIHRGQLADLEFGTGKLEQVANTATIDVSRSSFLRMERLPRPSMVVFFCGDCFSVYAPRSSY